MRWAVVCAALCLPIGAAASPIAEIICEDRDLMTQRLTVEFRAERQASGIRAPGQLMEVWTDDRGDWTLVTQNANGTMCIVAMGEAWEQDAPTSDQDPA